MTKMLRWLGLVSPLAVLLATMVVAAQLGGGSHAVAAPPQEQPKVGQAVLDALRTQNEVTVDIALTAPPSQAGGGFSLPTLTGDVAALQGRVLGGLSPGDFRLGSRFVAAPALSGAVTRTGLEKLLANPNVLRVDLPQGGTGGLAQSVPLINADDMHTAGFTGAGIQVAVLDTGLQTAHPQLANDLLAPQECFSITTNIPPQPIVPGVGGCPNGSDRQSGAGAAEDGNGHGTNVTGIITATGGGGFAIGVAPDAKIAAYKVINDNNTFRSLTADVGGALQDIILNRPNVKIINMSLGTGTLFNGNCDNANASNIIIAGFINTLRTNGVTAFASSMNDGSGTQMASPACISNVVSVGAVYDANLGMQIWGPCTDATTAADQVTCFSNSNATTDLMAPGCSITSTGLGGGMSTYCGTSQASPHAAGCAALLLQQKPALTPAQLEARLKTTPVSVTDAKNGLSFPRIECFGKPPPAAAAPYNFSIQGLNVPPNTVVLVTIIWTQGGIPIAYNFLQLANNQPVSTKVFQPAGADGRKVVVQAVNTNTGQVTPIANNNVPLTQPRYYPVFIVLPGPWWVQVGVNLAKTPLRLTLDTAGGPMTIVDGGSGDCDGFVNLQIEFSSAGVGCSFTPPAGYDGARGLVDVVYSAGGFFVRLTDLVVHAGNVLPPATTRGTWKFTPSFRGQGPRQPPLAFGSANLIGFFGTKSGTFGAANTGDKGRCLAPNPQSNPSNTVTLQGRANGLNIDGIRTITPAVGSSLVTVKLAPGGPAWTVDGDIIVDLFNVADCVNLPGSADMGVSGCASADDHCVGGIVVDPDIGALALQSDSSSSSDAWLLTAGIVAATAGAFALGGGAWYVRRRRVR